MTGVQTCALPIYHNAIHLIKNKQIDIDWFYFHHRLDTDRSFTESRCHLNLSKLCANTEAIPFLETLHLSIMDWNELSYNKNALSLLEKNQDKIDWFTLSSNPGIFICDYHFYKKHMDIHREELMKKVFHPRHLSYYLDNGYDSFDL